MTGERVAYASPPERLRSREALGLYATTGNPAFARLWAKLEAERPLEGEPGDGLLFPGPIGDNRPELAR